MIALGSRLDRPRLAPIGRTIGNARIVDLPGSGGMGGGTGGAVAAPWSGPVADVRRR